MAEFRRQVHKSIMAYQTWPLLWEARKSQGGPFALFWLPLQKKIFRARERYGDRPEVFTRSLWNLTVRRRQELGLPLLPFDYDEWVGVPSDLSKDQMREVFRAHRLFQRYYSRRTRYLPDAIGKAAIKAMAVLVSGGRGRQLEKKSTKAIELLKSGKTQKAIGLQLWPRLDPENARDRVAKIRRRQSK
jgi:hypothetical protein